MRPPVTTKADFYRRSRAGEFGNTNPEWFTIREWLGRTDYADCTHWGVRHSRLAGFPGGREFAAREATVVDLVRGVVPVDPPVATHLDVTVVPGESGSALIDSDGLLAGLLYAKATADGGGLAIDAVRVRLGLATLEPKSFASC